MSRNQSWVDIMWVVKCVDMDGHEWAKEMGTCQKCGHSTDRLFVCHEIGKQYCTACIKKDNLIKVLL
jgi:late competence protein required for DNA uptake (superfamily II DNA/RNA helicase)